MTAEPVFLIKEQKLRGDVTRLLVDLNAGKEGAGASLLALIYEELHDLAKNYMRGERKDHTLQTTALVHEAYLRLGGGKDTPWENKGHFLRAAAGAMRRVLIDHARRRLADKRRDKGHRETLEIVAVPPEDSPADLIALDGALKKLSTIEPQLVQVVELRYFAGLSVEEAGRVLDVTSRTVKRKWRIAKAWLKDEMDKE